MDEYELHTGQKFATFEQFDAFFGEYMKRTQQIFCVGYARSVERHNKLRSKKLDARLRYANVKYQCKCTDKMSFCYKKKFPGTVIINTAL